MVLEGSVLNFSWENDKIRDNSVEDDQLMILVYYPDKMTATRRHTGARRGALKDTVGIHKLKPGERAEAYLSFRSDDRLSISNSVYVGFVTGEGVIQAPIEDLVQKLPKVEPEINKVEPEIAKVELETAPTTEAIPAATFKSKLIAAIERAVEARSKTILPVEPKVKADTDPFVEHETATPLGPILDVAGQVKPDLVVASAPAVVLKTVHVIQVEPDLVFASAPAFVLKTVDVVQVKPDLVFAIAPALVREIAEVIQVESDLVFVIAPASVLETAVAIKSVQILEVYSTLGVKPELEEETVSAITRMSPGNSRSRISRSNSHKKRKALPVDSRNKLMRQQSLKDFRS
jgi:hypothetical protein